ncbi:hypothetical protein AM493_09415 [Flavobacterium akiainvivens]|uniref:DUF4252 domain-containing protein n=1 Tax=Flavobacterium akiainvivens TaxID=1202724 RepID=A0A0M9VI34_9FLAO|nr:hypothetical protein [Flavobacterium akiainvivens]KOS06226.1 hypothetical protein AM493_09415 [Flavobacterium akiainvivens]SFQ68699.1 hypothetical protein SAMN05444144_114117 [Flavobacterium akiainvivens]
MKTRILAIALFLCTLTAFAQTQKELETRLAAWCSNSVAGNHEALAEMYYPKIFEVVPKDKLIESLKSMANGNGYSLLFLQTPLNAEYSKIKNIDGGNYSLVKYDSQMKMIFTSKLTKQEGNEMVETLKAGMNTQDVIFNEADSSIIIKKKDEVIAVADSLTNNKWTFLSRSGRPLLVKIFTEKVLKGLGL